VYYCSLNRGIPRLAIGTVILRVGGRGSFGIMAFALLNDENQYLFFACDGLTG
jgi:hypothetical protein